MAITTKKVSNPKVFGVYQVHDIDLKINLNNPKQHNVVVTSINKKKGIARVKTITSLEKRSKGKFYFKNRKLNDVKNGNILVIPRSKFRTKILSGINHNTIVVPLNKLYYKEPNDTTVVTGRYKKLIKRK